MRRAWLPVLVGALLLAAGLAGRPASGGPVPAAGAAGRVVFDALFYLFGVVLVLGLASLVWLIWPRRDDAPLPPLERRRHRLAGAVALALAFLALWWRIGHGGSLPLLSRPAPAGSGPGGAAQVRAAVAGGGAGFDWIAAALVLVVLAVAAAMVWRGLGHDRRRPSMVPAPPPTVLAEELEGAIEGALDEPDPRRAVIAAWARVERVLAVHGAGRRPAEAPLEYARRAPAAAGLPRHSLDALADLYEWARFSTHEVTGPMRADALSRLAAVREGLRAGL